MDDPRAETAKEFDAALERLAARRHRVVFGLTGAMLATYFGFLLLVAYAKPMLGVLVMPGLSVGIVLGALVIAVAWALTGIYVRWANRTYDVELARLRDAAGAGTGMGTAEEGER